MRTSLLNSTVPANRYFIFNFARNFEINTMDSNPFYTMYILSSVFFFGGDGVILHRYYKADIYSLIFNTKLSLLGVILN